MANTLTSLLVTIMSRGLPALRKACVMSRMVRTDFSMELSKVGKTIDLPVPSDLTVSDVTSTSTPLSPTALTPETKQISLNKWKRVHFALDDQELTQIEYSQNFVPMQMEAAFKALGEQVNADLMALYADVYGYVGTAATTPFATTVAAATDARKALANQLAPFSPRYGVLNPDGMANALALAAFSNLQQTGDSGVIIEGLLGRKFGFDWAEDQQIPSHTAGTGASYLINNGGGYAAGIKTVTVDTGSGTILVGDIVTFAGVTGTYVVTSALSGNSFSFYPGLAGAVADNAAVTLKATHVSNLAFHRDAFALCVRPLDDVAQKLIPSLQIVTMQDPLSGIPVRLEISRQNKQTLFDMDILYGVKTLRPEYACRIAG